jgi:hypothetical protein
LLWLLVGAATGLFTTLEGADKSLWTGMYPVIWGIWVFSWSWTGYWAFATGNKLWMIIVRSAALPRRQRFLALLRPSPARSASCPFTPLSGLAHGPSQYNLQQAWYFIMMFILFIDFMTDATDVSAIGVQYAALGLESPYCCDGLVRILGLLVGTLIASTCGLKLNATRSNLSALPRQFLCDPQASTRL